MASGTFPHPKWVLSPPSMYDIVACYYPETKPKAELKLRPCLVRTVLQSKSSGLHAVEVYFGTKNLKTQSRKGSDLIIQNTSDLDEIGLAMATRFDLADTSFARLPWNPSYFGCWTGYDTPIIGFLPESYQKEYAYCRMNRLGRK